MEIRSIKNILFAGILLFAVATRLSAQTPDWTMLTPELGGTLKLGLAVGDDSKWFSDFKTVKEKSRDMETIVTLKDDIGGKSEISYIIRPLKDSKGAVMQLTAKNLPENARLIWTYGGASNQTPDETATGIQPHDCFENVFSIEGNSFTLYYGTSRKLKIMEGLTPPGEKLRLGDANQQETPLQLLHSGKKTTAQVLTSEVTLENETAYYFCFYFLNPKADYNYYMLPKLFENGSYVVNKETEWMKSTPD